MWHKRQNERAAKEAGHRTGGSRGRAPPSSPPFLGRNGDPPPGRRGPRAAPQGGFGGTPRGVRGTGRPGRWSGLDWRRLAPARWVPARSRAGIQAFSKRKPGRKKSRGRAPAPLFRARSLLARSFWRSCRIVPVEGLLRGPCTRPDLGRFFVWGAQPRGFPLGKLSPEVTDEGAIGLPNEAIEKPR